MSTNIEAELYKLLSLVSPSFPTGSFSFSHGLEYAISIETVHNAASLQEWIEGLLYCGSPFLDGILLKEAWLAANSNNDLALLSICETAVALRSTSELALECESEGTALLRTLVKIQPNSRIADFAKQLQNQGIKPHYAACLGAVTAFRGIHLRLCLIGFLNTFSSNIINAGIKLIPIGQTQGQAVLGALEPKVIEVAENIRKKSLDDVGNACILCDIYSSTHETVKSRLFRS